MSAGREPSWELYATFLEVMREGSLSGASRVMDVAQPTVRRRVEALEEALGTALFVRGVNGLVPTRGAQALVPYAEEMEAMARAMRRAASGEEETRGVVRVTASEVMSVEVLPELLRGLRERYPELTIELSVSDETEDLSRRDADIAVRMTRPTSAALWATRIGALGLGLFAAPRYVNARGLPQRLEELSSHALLGEDRKGRIERGLETLGVKVKEFALRTDHDLAYLAAIRAGVGIGFCQAKIGEREGWVRVLPGVGFELEVWLVMHEDLKGSRRVRGVWDHLKEGLTRHVGGEAS